MKERRIIEIKDAISKGDIEFKKGQTNVFSYTVKNVSPFPIREIQVQAFTVDPDGKATTVNYVKSVTGHKESLMPKDQFTLSVGINIPEEYNDTYIIKSGEFKGTEVPCPIDIDFRVNGVEIVSSSSI